MSKKHYISQWEEWVELCNEAELNPHETADIGVGLGGGDCIEFIYSGEYPEERSDENKILQ